jgi:uncharacterized membrane protein
MSIRAKLNIALRRYFLSGILVIVPLIITILVLRFLFSGVDNLLSPLIAKLIGRKIPGLGIVTTIILIFIAGFLTANVIGSRLFRIWEIFFIKTPLVRTIYGSSKKLVEAMTTTGMFSFGFLTNEIRMDLADKTDELIAVFIPSTPTPFTGWTLLFRREEVITLDMSVEEGVKFFVSGGIASPEMFREKDVNAIERRN